MKSSGCPIDIVLAEDDEDDVLLFREAWDEVNLPHRIHWVKDGEELLQCLLHPESVGIKNFRPRLIFLDLNMPKKNGLEALQEIKADPHLKKMPILVFTTSKSEEDVVKTYKLGVNSFIQKPINYEELVHLLRLLGQYWFQIVKLPDWKSPG